MSRLQVLTRDEMVGVIKQNREKYPYTITQRQVDWLLSEITRLQERVNDERKRYIDLWSLSNEVSSDLESCRNKVESLGRKCEAYRTVLQASKVVRSGK